MSKVNSKPANPLAVLLSDETPVGVFGKPCVIQRIIDGLPEEYKVALNQQMTTLFRDGGPSDFDIYKRMTLAGFKVSPATVNRHRGNKCSCLKGIN